MASDNLPKELREFKDLFVELSYKHTESRLWTDFLEIIICCYAMQQMEERYLQIVKSYNQKELKVIAQMFAIMIELYSDRISPVHWYDGLGTFYECFINTPSKASRTGQFFTPQYVCDMNARMLLDPSSRNTGLKINDCACGSGRMLLAANTAAPGNYYFGEDIDPMCVYLTAVNFLFHGMEGQIVCHDSIDPCSFYFGYEIRKPIRFARMIPVIRKIEKEQAYIYQIGVQMMKEFEAKQLLEAEQKVLTTPTITTNLIPNPPIIKPVKKETPQLKLF